MKNLNYGVIGNCRSAALVSETGFIDWCCLPSFNSTSVFASLLDQSRGGSFGILTDSSYKITQQYSKNTNILITSFDNGADVFRVIDFMPRYKLEDGSIHNPPDVIRFIKYKSGNPKFKIHYNPCLEYAKHPTETTIHKEYIKSSTTKGTYNSIYLYTDFNKEAVVNGDVIHLKKDGFFLMSYNQKILTQTVDRNYLKLQRTKVYWLNWTEGTKSYAQYNDSIMRSALVLKLLSYEKTGAVLAAITTSLPETIGEVRNWDYRFCWLRDASMVIKVLISLGHNVIAKRYLQFILNIIPEKSEHIQIMYGINGEKKLTEKILDHLDGYEDSSPVRIGNDAYRQTQNDIYGILMDVIYQQFQTFDTSLESSENFWTITRDIVKTVQKNWTTPDRGIWEIRTDQKHFTFSKVLCWVAIDRAIKIATIIRKNEYVTQWTKLANEIKSDILEHAWNPTVNAFTQFYGSADLDASTLLMESYGFIEANDPKFISTVIATEKELCKDGLMYRYKNKDDFGLPTSSFTVCTFWMINSLHKIGEKEKAKKMFDQLLTYSNHVNLFSEDIDFDSKRLLGNFPQAYSHLALIETAINLSDGALLTEEKILEAIHSSH